MNCDVNFAAGVNAVLFIAASAPLAAVTDVQEQNPGCQNQEERQA